MTKINAHEQFNQLWQKSEKETALV